MASKSQAPMPAEPALPAYVRVGHEDIKIERATREELIDAEGEFDSRKQRIRLGDWLPPQQAAETMLHELDHAIWPHGGVLLIGDIEENHVGRLSPARAQLMRDNEALFDWIRHNLRGTRDA